MVKDYCYLGIIFSSSGSFKNACNVLHDKALKAFYMLRQIHPNNNIKIAFNLFDTLILPILSYGGIVWAPLYANNLNANNFNTVCNNSPMEKLNVRLCKYLLGVHRKSTNDAVRGETGRFPILITILNHSYRYFQRMNESSNPSLAKISCGDGELRLLN